MTIGVVVATTNLVRSVLVGRADLGVEA